MLAIKLYAKSIKKSIKITKKLNLGIDKTLKEQYNKITLKA